MPAGWGRRIRHGMQRYAINQTAPTAAAPTHIGLNPVDPLDSAAGYLPGTTEPAATNGYARQPIAFTALAAFTTYAADASIPLLNSGAISFGPSVGGGFSPSGPYTFISFWNTATLSSVSEATDYWGRAAVTAPTQSVAGAGITLTIAAAAISMGLITS